MQTANSLWIFFALTLGIIALPGLDMAFIAGSATAGGLRGGLVAMAGVVAGGFVHVLLNVLGLAALLMLWPGAFQALLLAGCVYMAWIGWGMLRAPVGGDEGASAASAAAPPPALGSMPRVFMRGMMSCLLNPKAYAFMLAVFPAYLQVTQRSVAAQAALLAAIIAGNQIVVYGAVAAAAAGARHWLGPRGATAGWMVRGVGLVLILAAVFTLWRAWP
ncbi:LysE family translocator [Roseateles sp. PN1]|uniref:LysE family translocator n=1 Tax=Roseateles sp. PN1 TaxID=3137372 RepID=UPI003138F390